MALVDLVALRGLCRDLCRYNRHGHLCAPIRFQEVITTLGSTDPRVAMRLGAIAGIQSVELVAFHQNSLLSPVSILGLSYRLGLFYIDFRTVISGRNQMQDATRIATIFCQDSE